MEKFQGDRYSIELQDPVQRGNHFLLVNAKNFNSTTDMGLDFRDNFSQLLIYDLTRNLSEELVNFEQCDRTWNYFIGEQQLIPGDYPDDLDTTSLALLLLPADRNLVHSIIDEMLQLTTPDGIVMIYFDKTRPRTDPFVCINVLRLMYHYGRESEPALLQTKSWLLQVLIERTYLDGSRYYTSPEVFTYYLSQLLKENPESELYKEMSGILSSRLNERIDIDGDAMEIAMRVLACRSLGISNEPDKQRLVALQCEDGGWGASCLCCTGKKGTRIGNRGLATALAVNALG